MGKRILFICVENAGKSQIADAFVKKYGKIKFIISSAGKKLVKKQAKIDCLADGSKSRPNCRNELQRSSDLPWTLL